MSTIRTAVALVAVVVAVALVEAQAPSVSGRWTATFETQVGQQIYEFNFVANGNTLTGTIKGNLTGESKVENGKTDGKKITFTENSKFMDVPLTINYVGDMTSADEIKFTRTIEGVGDEELVAR